ncbi:hypothetical protein [uncultured Chryseobacterium sp.]|uniref:hypothetical protein n=1 Tax=uncultured Chryseobacterium sp. TaxID=259322 RepID=UPI0025D4D836|nr:hypothetical protein [uncultured Chryseobacterium sp.]
MSRKVLIPLLYLYALAFSVLKTVRLPNEWAVSHWMLDYRFGFIKRGLAGEIFGLLFTKNEFSIGILSVAMIGLLYLLIFLIAIKETYRQNCSIHSVAFCLIFFLSQYMVFSAHLIGYLDHIIFLIAILVLYLIRLEKVLLPSILASISILIHEISFFIMLPVSILALLMPFLSNGNLSLSYLRSSGALKRTVLFLILPVLTVMCVYAFQEANGRNMYPLIYHYLSHTGFVTQRYADSVASAYTKSFSYYFADESRHFFQRIFVSRCSIWYGLPILFMMLMLFKMFRKVNTIIPVLIVAVSVFPLLLHAIAWDTFRIWAFPFMLLFLGWYAADSPTRTIATDSDCLSFAEKAFFTVSFLLVTLIPNFLFDGASERFSIPLRLALILPVLAAVFYLNKQAPAINGRGLHESIKK